MPITGIKANNITTDAAELAALKAALGITASSGLSVHGAAAGQRYSGWGINPQGSAGTITTQRLFAIPVVLPANVNRLGIFQATSGSGGTIHRVLLYTDSNGLPGSLVSGGDTGTLDASSGGGVIKEAAVTINNSAGPYWLCGVTNSGGQFWRIGGPPTFQVHCDGGGRLPYRTASYDPTTTPPATFGACSMLFASAAFPILVYGKD
jgi:hypothetical protein